MRRKLAWLLTLLSGGYLLTIGILPDPLPFLDEAFALTIFVKAASYLGHDVRGLLPFFGKRRAKSAPRRATPGPMPHRPELAWTKTVDV
ncbi:hypothetical protein JIN85_13080 [Luteolibacter pohnpeiensis]|uniref:Uncharacterized protein n=1 Tax=Luteolibacter pohnpeiensis TaxID=454153 RepID=A0A934VXB1_9BACT|nr:hypothetical protein [Luteolibacter pohnpeiensis]MBK1883354.1 hypothetical protein [Luteolibacter pohnpeiensis]